MTSENDTPAIKNNKPRLARHSGRFIRGLGLLMSLAAFTISAYLVYALYYQQPDILNGELVRSTRDVRADLDRLKQNNASHNQQIEKLKESQQTLIEAMSKTRQALGRNRVDWILAETEQLMIIANQRVQLAGDLDTAATALEIANQRLRDLADPGLLPVRKLLAGEILALKSAERADIAGVALRLSTLADSVGTLPLSLEFQKRSQTAPLPKTTQDKQNSTTKSKGFIKEFWDDVMGVISIRTNVDSYKPLLPPEQQYFLRENLRLMILGAQQAALHADHQTYRNNLITAKRWADEYFDNRSQALTHLSKELDSLSKMALKKPPPKINGSLGALRKIIRKKAGQ